MISGVRKKKNEGVRWIFSTAAEGKGKRSGRVVKEKKDDRCLCCFSVRTAAGLSRSRRILRGVETEKKGETPWRPANKEPPQLQLAVGCTRRMIPLISRLRADSAGPTGVG